ncbi:2-aminoethylphosphonate--pyruvate transaminase [Aquicella siphonis]|uniref:2-aminoethylphosphonate--pyruvate transaminase n=1 Tax=Aquicella siphonis TaxID=254247 RepID=A0A5E4PGT9_9COXI|nr:2-aminoethylphosphonate--pyruvate transaminase [Aquicella siphonis]VVC75692.1 2-aminoethylphosphonate--pyruvate transaminase [Aquicella siphonis]
MQHEEIQNPYILLTPGPLSTSPTVRAAMRFDSCTWDEDYKGVVMEIRARLLAAAGCDPSSHTTVLMQGSGTFGVESVLGSSVNKSRHHILILQNGVYGRRMTDIAKVLSLPHTVYEAPENTSFDSTVVHQILENNPSITHVAMVHCETTTGILNDLDTVSDLARQHGKYFIVDAMSSFAGMEIDVTRLNMDFLISSANKCIQGVPGFSFVICKRETLNHLCRDNSKSLSLDLFAQWKEMEADPGKWRYTSPTHAVLAFRQALAELEQEGGVRARAVRYRENQALLSAGMTELGFETYIDQALQSPIITTFLEPDRIPQTTRKFEFAGFYQYLKERGFVIYPGKVANRSSFRIGSIGHLFPSDVLRFVEQVRRYIAQHR